MPVASRSSTPRVTRLAVAPKVHVQFPRTAIHTRGPEQETTEDTEKITRNSSLRVLRESPRIRRALRAVDQRSNPPRKEFQNSFHTKSPAIPTLIKTRCAPVITKTHHLTSLTEEHDAQKQARRHRDTKARSGGEGRRDQVARTHPHSVPPRLVPTPCLRAYVPSCLRAFFSSPSPLPQLCQISKRTHRDVPIPPSFTPPRTKAHHPIAPVGERTHSLTRQNPPEPAQTRHNPPHREICKTNPPPPPALTANAGAGSG
jgi:hypothetical protein